MRLPMLLAACCAALSFAPGLARAQNATLTENINNTGIPRNAPALGLSNIYGLNPCATGTSVGVSTPLFGVGGAISTIDHECETRNNAAVVVTGLKDEALAREILCEIKDVRQAAIRIGKPCLEDRHVAAAAPPPAALPPGAPPRPATAAAMPTSTVPAGKTPAPAASAAPELAANAPAFCHTSGLDLQLYPECTGHGVIIPADPQPVAVKRPHAKAARQAESRSAPRAEPAAAHRAHTAEPGTRQSMAQAAPRPGCNIPSALLAVYPECSGGAAEARQLAQLKAAPGDHVHLALNQPAD